MNIKSSIVAILVLFIAFLTPIIPLLVIVAMAIFIDTIMGIIRAYKKKIKITSKKLSGIISKMLLYQLTVISVYFIDHFLIGEFFKLFSDINLVATKVVVTTLFAVEIKSIHENIEGAYNINLWQQFKKILTRVNSMKNEIGEELGDDFINKLKKD
jgi:hypothetical protein